MHIVRMDWAVCRRFLRDPVDEVGVKVAGRQLARAAGRDADQVFDAPLVCDEERFEDGRDEDRAPLMRLEDRLIERASGLSIADRSALPAPVA